MFSMFLIILSMAFSVFAVAPSSVVMRYIPDHVEMVNGTHIYTEPDLDVFEIGVLAVDNDSAKLNCTLKISYVDVDTGVTYTNLNVYTYEVTNNTEWFTTYHFGEYQDVFDVQDYEGVMSCNDGTDTLNSKVYTFTISNAYLYDASDITKATINGAVLLVIGFVIFIPVFITLLVFTFGKKFVWDKIIR
jgi:hypothetical protein